MPTRMEEYLDIAEDLLELVMNENVTSAEIQAKLENDLDDWTDDEIKQLRPLIISLVLWKEHGAEGALDDIARAIEERRRLANGSMRAALKANREIILHRQARNAALLELLDKLSTDVAN